MQCGLLGRTLGYSYSPQIHRHLGDYSYSLFEKEPEQLEEFLKTGGFSGLNVTIPYKKSVIPYCAELSPIAKKLSAVNTIVRKSDGSLIGHNTDYAGFLAIVRHSGLAVSGKKALVLGSGGASNVAVAVLRELGANVVVISRSGKNNYQNLHLHRDAALIVNATPVGTYPNVDASPLSLDLFPNLEGVLDVIYNPARTKLLLQAEQRGLVTENGLLMLVAQAKESAEWFTGTSIQDAEVTRIYHILKRQMENIILIGMPGCGKSTVGAILAAKTGHKFVDSDTEIEKITGMSIPEIFKGYDETYFRKLEAGVLKKIGAESGLVVATGGGCVTQDENYENLHRNGTIIWLKRDLNLLATDGRPLSQNGSIQQIYQTRKPLYEAFSDFTVNNEGTPEEIAAKICGQLEEEL